MLNLIKECLEGTNYNAIRIDSKTYNISDFLENLKGDFLVIPAENGKEIVNLKLVSKFKLFYNDEHKNRITTYNDLPL